MNATIWQREGVFSRLSWCSAGYFLSTVVASLVALSVVITLQQVEMRSIEDLMRMPGHVLSLLFWAWPNILRATILLTVIPSAIFIVAAELLKLRGRLPYVIFGALLGPAELVWLTGKVPSSAEDSPLFAIAMTAGALAGLAYWHIAVRRPICRAAVMPPLNGAT
jgi:hypothetical protein